jgi:hypothetical protein
MASNRRRLLPQGKWLFPRFLRCRGWRVRAGEITRNFGFRKDRDTARFAIQALELSRRQGRPMRVAFGFRKCRITLKTPSPTALADSDLFDATRIDMLARGYASFTGK